MSESANLRPASSQPSPKGPVSRSGSGTVVSCMDGSPRRNGDSAPLLMAPPTNMRLSGLGLSG